MDNAEIVELLNRLIVANRDSAEGYEHAAGAVENPDYQALFRQYAEQRRHFVDALSEEVRTYGGEPAASGDLAGTFQRAWMNLRAALSAGDQAIMDECDQIEQATLTLYADTLPQNLPEAVKALVRSQLVDVRIAHERIHGINGALSQT